MLLVILSVIKFTTGFVQNMAVLIGITVGYLVTIALGWTDFSGIQRNRWCVSSCRCSSACRSSTWSRA